MINRINRRSFVAGTTAALTLPTLAFGQSGQLRLVVPYGPGGSTDTAGRVLAERMSADTGKTIVVYNARPKMKTRPVIVPVKQVAAAGKAGAAAPRPLDDEDDAWDDDDE